MKTPRLHPIEIGNDTYLTDFATARKVYLGANRSVKFIKKGHGLYHLKPTPILYENGNDKMKNIRKIRDNLAELQDEIEKV